MSFDSASIIGVREVGGNAGMARGYNCFVCANRNAGYDLPIFVDTKVEGEKLVGIFNQTIRNSAWLDFRHYTPTYIQVKVYACDAHRSGLSELSERIMLTPAQENRCHHDLNKSHQVRVLTPAVISG